MASDARARSCVPQRFPRKDQASVPPARRRCRKDRAAAWRGTDAAPAPRRPRAHVPRVGGNVERHRVKIVGQRPVLRHQARVARKEQLRVRRAQDVAHAVLRAEGRAVFFHIHALPAVVGGDRLDFDAAEGEFLPGRMTRTASLPISESARAHGRGRKTPHPSAFRPSFAPGDPRRCGCRAPPCPREPPPAAAPAGKTAQSPSPPCRPRRSTGTGRGAAPRPAPAQRSPRRPASAPRCHPSLSRPPPSEVPRPDARSCVFMLPHPRLFVTLEAF